MRGLISFVFIAISAATIISADLAFSSDSGSLSGNGASNIDSRRGQRVRYHDGKPTSNKPQTSGSFSSVGASNVDSRRGQRVRYRYGKPTSNKPQTSGSLSSVGASNVDERPEQ